jgi:hypothetical protein
MIVANLIPEIDIENTLRNFAMVFLKNGSIISLKISQKYDNFGCEFSKHIVVIEQLFPFAHSNSFEKHLLLTKVTYLQ